MNENTITRLQSRADTKAKWEKVNPILLENEIGYEKDTGRYKMGDNKKTHWNDLPYYVDAGNGNGEKSIILNDDVNNFSELKVFFIKSIDMINKKIYLSKEHIDKPEISTNDYTDNTFDTPEYAKGDIFDLIVSATIYNKGRSHVHFVSKIVSIDKNVIGYDNELPFTDLLNDTAAYSHSFFVSSKPDKGIYDIGGYSVAEGAYSIAAGKWSHAEGYGNIAAGRFAHAEGYDTKAGYGAHAEGQSTTAKGINSHAEGYLTQAKGAQAHAEGRETIAKKDYSHAEGYNTHANELASHSEGNLTEANGKYSHSEGYDTTAENETSHAEGYQTYSAGQASHTEGIKTRTDSKGAHAEGGETYAFGEYSHVEGYKTLTQNQASHAEGKETVASGEASHAEGYGTVASGIYSHSEGYSTISEGSNAHAEGRQTKAQGIHGAHAEGFSTQATGEASHAENRSTRASGNASHAEGNSTYAYGEASHTEGVSTQTSIKAIGAHAEGEGTYANTANQHVQGKYNISDTEDKYAHIVGNGSNSKRSNAHTLDWEGNAWFAGEVTVGENKDKLITQSKAQIEAAKVNNQILQLKEILNQIEYYEKSNITPTPSNYFRFEINDDNTTATIYFDGERNSYNDFIYEGEVVIPYSYTDVLNEKTYLVTKIGDTGFARGEKITKITMPNSIKELGEYCFDLCTSLEKLVISTQLEYISSGAFSSCTSLKSLDLPNTLETVEDYAFIDCSSLKEILFYGNEAEWENIFIGSDQDEYFSNINVYYNDSLVTKEYVDSNLEQINIDINSCRYYDQTNIVPMHINNEMAGIEFNINNSHLTMYVSALDNTVYNTIKNDLIIPYVYIDKTNNKKYIIKSLFLDGGAELNNCTLPNTISNLELKDIQFNKITLPTSITSIKISDDLDTPGRSQIANIYYHGSDLQWNKIQIEQNDNQMKSSNIYYQLSNVTQDYVKKIHSDSNEISNEVKRLYHYDDIQPISNVIPFAIGVNKNTKLATVSKGIVPMPTPDKDLIIPYETEVGKEIYTITDVGKFNEIRSITGVIFPKTIVSIGKQAFENCENITYLRIPKSLKNIGENAFNGCDKLKNVFYDGTKEDWDKITIGKNNNSLIESNIQYNYSKNIIIDNQLNEESENPIQNKIITEELTNVNENFNNLNQKINSLHYYGNQNLTHNVEITFIENNDYMPPKTIWFFSWHDGQESETAILHQNCDSHLNWFSKENGDTFQKDNNITKIIIPRGNKFFDNNFIKETFPNLKTIIRIDEDGIIERITF